MTSTEAPPSYYNATSDHPPPFHRNLAGDPTDLPVTSGRQRHPSAAEEKDEIMERLRAKQEKADAALGASNEPPGSSSSTSNGHGESSSWLQRKMQQRAEKKKLEMEQEKLMKARSAESMARASALVEARRVALDKYERDVASAPPGVTVPVPSILKYQGSPWMSSGYHGNIAAMSVGMIANSSGGFSF